jgi:hypothetical protein
MSFKKISGFFLAILLVANIAFAAQKPVMVIRFNQSVVSYENHLNKITSKALEIKPDVFFDVVTVVPQTNNNRKDEEIKQQAEELTKTVLEKIAQNGVDGNNIRITYQDSPSAANNEIHIFVR